MFSLRDHHLLEIHAGLLREGISVITNSFLSDLEWLHASLPIREGGLGLDVALSAFLASAASTSGLQDLFSQHA